MYKRQVCREVTEVTPKIVTLIDDMLETMYEANGVGLAAPQVLSDRRDRQQYCFRHLAGYPERRGLVVGSGHGLLWRHCRCV